ncbi:MAG: N-acetyl-gamma-glutamyl-phosphate reductase [Clostridia bacterium]|nr:N-acetyl-gamma-glutamyl-phosphate reductase [Clostridia bacterium]
MCVIRVFVDGSAGTTGLRIRERLLGRRDIELLSLEERFRKDADARREIMNRADVVFLCLPDAAAAEAAGLVEEPDVVLIDTSTAHRTADRWEYGFPELRGRRERISRSKRIANPGCHATGVIALVEPLVRTGFLGTDTWFTAYSLTGYSGGGKKMIAEYEDPDNREKLCSPRMYGLGQCHKHLPEIMKICMLEKAPAFCPVVSSYYSGMQVTVAIPGDGTAGPEGVLERYREYYGETNGVIRVLENTDEEGFLSSSGLSGRDDLEITAWGSPENIVLCARFDNLGKGASGAAIQNMNIIMGTDELESLITK